jgi:hypothetical protein
MKSKLIRLVVPIMLGLIFVATSCEKSPITKSDPGNLASYRGHNGISYDFKVTGTIDGSVWGGADGFYTDDSDLSTAAVHAGKLNAGQTAVITVTILPGRDHYYGSTQNGVTSDDYDSWLGSFTFE